MKINIADEIGEKDNLEGAELVKKILKKRGVRDISAFLEPESPLDIPLSRFGKKYETRFKTVLKILRRIKDKKLMIVVYTDYDADGITGGAILWETLHLSGFRVMPYVPDRRTEGYGFSVTGIDNVIRLFDPALIISVDHGITKVKEVAYAKAKKISVIITDHHLKAEKEPEADAIFHIPALSGSGVAYFFAREIFKYFGRDSGNFRKLEENFSADYPALAATGTIADLVPLTGPSRSLVKWGLAAYQNVKRPGIRHILKQAGIAGKKITPYEVGFMIAPRINAVGRLEKAIDALRLLCTTSDVKASELSAKIGNLNTDRQMMVEKSVREAEKMISEKPGGVSKKKIIILSSENWNEGIIGLIASKLVEKYYRPVLIMTRNDGFYKGSARSIPAFHITDFLRSQKEFLIDAGGHSQAAGFTIKRENIGDFVSSSEKKALRLISDRDLEKEISVDLKIPIEKINLPLVRELEKLEPFGIGNPRPVFLSTAILSDTQLLGVGGKHLKMHIGSGGLKNLHGAKSLEIIAFNKGILFKELSRTQNIKICYTVEIDRWGGNEKLKGFLRELL